MAVGLEWRPNSAGDIEKLLVLADEKMYEDKRQYYNGVRERRKPFELEKE
jgi:hypothetical protein